MLQRCMHGARSPVTGGGGGGVGGDFEHMRCVLWMSIAWMYV